MVVLEISAQDIQNNLNDLEREFEIIERLEFFRGRLFFSVSSVSGCLEIRPSAQSLVFSIPMDSLVLENEWLQAAWAFRPKWVLELARDRIAAKLEIPKQDILIEKTKESINIHLMNEFVWDKLDIKFLPRKLRLNSIQSNEAGLRLEFDLSKPR